MILSVSNLLNISFIVLIAFIYKTSAKQVISFLDNKIHAIKLKFKNIDNIKKDSLQELEKINDECELIAKEIKYILTHCEKTLAEIIQNFEANAAIYDKEQQQKINFTIAQKKDAILKNYKEEASLEIEKQILKYASMHNSSIDINSLISLLTNKIS